MSQVARHLRSFVLPVTIAGLVPAAIARASRSPLAPASVPLGIAGAVVVLSGLSMLAWTVGLFARVGEGTLAPGIPRASSSSSARTRTSATR